MDSLRSLPKVRHDVVAIRQVARGEVLYIYKVQETQDYYHLNETQHGILKLLDGTRTAEEMVRDFNARSPGKAIDLEFLEGFIDGFQETEIFEKSREEKRRILMMKLRAQRHRRAANKSRSGNVFEITYSAWNPNEFFNRIVRRFSFFWSRGFVVLSLACILLMFIIWIARWEEMVEGTIALYTFQGYTIPDFLQFYLILFVIGFLHESAHGLTCKHFGGNVTQMGLLFLYFTPCFYVDVSDAYLLDSHFKRQWVIFAGGYLELFLCSLATFFWALTTGGTLIHELAYKFLLMTGVSALAFNFIPLIKLDGYYCLMDYLEIPDLWERSFAYTSGWFQKHVFRLPVELETVTRKVGRIFITYSLSSMAYKFSLIGVFLVFIWNVLLRSFGSFGYLLFLLVFFLLFRHYILQLVRFFKFTILDKREVLMATKSLVYLGIASASLILMSTLPRFPVSVRGDFILEPLSTAIVRPTEEGRVEQVLVREGLEVERGEIVAVLGNDDLRRQLQSLEGRMGLCDRETAEAAGRGDRALLARKMREGERIRKELEVLRKRVEELSLRSPITGVVTTPRLEDLVGAYLLVGDPFCEVAGPGNLVARIPVRERHRGEIEPGQRVALQLVSFPFRTVPGRVLFLAPASGMVEFGTVARASQVGLEPGVSDFEVIVEVLDPPGGLRYGMAGTARIRVGDSTVAGRAGWSFTRWIGSQIW